MKSSGLLVKSAALASFVLLIAFFVFYQAGGFEMLYDEGEDDTAESTVVQPLHKEEPDQEEDSSALTVDNRRVVPPTANTTPAIKKAAPKVRKARNEQPNIDSALADAQEASIGSYWFGHADTTDTAAILEKEARMREASMMAASSKVAIVDWNGFIVDKKKVFLKKKKKAKKKSNQPTTKK